jgi:hypothetical protein
MAVTRKPSESWLKWGLRSLALDSKALANESVSLRLCEARFKVPWTFLPTLWSMTRISRIALRRQWN